MQEDKEGMFDTVETLRGALALFAPMIETMIVKKEKMYASVREDFSNATDLADYLVGKGMPFRESHAVVGQVVLACINENKYLLDMSLEEFQSYSNLIEADIFNALTPENVVNARDVAGGTAKNRVEEQITTAIAAMEKNNNWIQLQLKTIQV